MNTKPDEETLALWLEDELEGEAFVQVESWAAGQPDQLAARQMIRDWRSRISLVIPKSDEPPYPDFFNSRILAAIGDLEHSRRGAVGTISSCWRSAWFMPAAAAAGMTLAFWMGTRATSAPVTEANSTTPVVYTPETGVRADYFASRKADATVIVLDGVPAISDSLDFLETASAKDPDATDPNTALKAEQISEITQ